MFLHRFRRSAEAVKVLLNRFRRSARVVKMFLHRFRRSVRAVKMLLNRFRRSARVVKKLLYRFRSLINSILCVLMRFRSENRLFFVYPSLFFCTFAGNFDRYFSSRPGPLNRRGASSGNSSMMPTGRLSTTLIFFSLKKVMRIPYNKHFRAKTGVFASKKWLRDATD